MQSLYGSESVDAGAGNVRLNAVKQLLTARRVTLRPVGVERSNMRVMEGGRFRGLTARRASPTIAHDWVLPGSERV